MSMIVTHIVIMVNSSLNGEQLLQLREAPISSQPRVPKGWHVASGPSDLKILLEVVVSLISISFVPNMS